MIESKRLLIRPFTVSDSKEAFQWFGDPEVMKYIPSGPDQDISATRRRIENYIDVYEKVGYSKFVIIEKCSGKLIGDCGVLPIKEFNVNELGLRFRKEKWGRGYAVEAGRVIIDYWFNDLHENEISAIIEHQNLRSIKLVTKKLAFIYQREFFCYNTNFKLYVRRRN